jgi:hypothetical protein
LFFVVPLLAAVSAFADDNDRQRVTQLPTSGLVRDVPELDINERSLESRILHQQHLIERAVLKREIAERDVSELLARSADAQVLTAHVGGLLSHFEKRDGSPLSERDIHLVARDINILISRKFHFPSPKRIKAAFKKAHQTLKQGFHKAGKVIKSGTQKVGKFMHDEARPWLKKNALTIAGGLVTAMPLPGIQGVGVAMVAANMAKTAATIGKTVATAVKVAKAAKAAKNVVKGAQRVNDATSGIQNAIQQFIKREVIEARAETLAKTHMDIAAMQALAGLRRDLQPAMQMIGHILRRHGIVMRNHPSVVTARFAESAGAVVDHLMKREAEPEADADADPEAALNRLWERTVAGLTDAVDVLWERDQRGEVKGLSQGHVEALSGRLVEHMHRRRALVRL